MEQDVEKPIEKPIESSMFEGMFVRALQPTGTFAEELRAAGFDMKRIEPRYTIQVWLDCVNVARRHLFPHLDQPRAYRELGRLYISGFFETIIGKLISAAFPVMGPAAVIKRLPKTWKAARKDVVVEPIQEGEKRWRVVFKDRYALPDFIAGLVEVAGKRTGVDLHVSVGNRSEAGFELLLTW